LKSSKINQTKTEIKAVKRKFQKDSERRDDLLFLKFTLSIMSMKDHQAKEKNQVLTKETCSARRAAELMRTKSPT
jgi:hypothetical protein